MPRFSGETALETPARLGRSSHAVDSVFSTHGYQSRAPLQSRVVGGLPLQKCASVGSGVSLSSVVSVLDGAPVPKPPNRALHSASPAIPPEQASVASANPSVCSVADVIKGLYAKRDHPFVPEQETLPTTDGYPCVKIGASVVPLRDDCDRRPGDPKFNPKVLALPDSVLKVIHGILS